MDLSPGEKLALVPGQILCLGGTLIVLKVIRNYLNHKPLGMQVKTVHETYFSSLLMRVICFQTLLDCAIKEFTLVLALTTINWSLTICCNLIFGPIPETFGIGILGRFAWVLKGMEQH